MQLQTLAANHSVWLSVVIALRLRFEPFDSLETVPAMWTVVQQSKIVAIDLIVAQLAFGSFLESHGGFSRLGR